MSWTEQQELADCLSIVPTGYECLCYNDTVNNTDCVQPNITEIQNNCTCVNSSVPNDSVLVSVISTANETICSCSGSSLNGTNITDGNSQCGGTFTSALMNDTL